jgi:hypothetical protein
MADNRVSFQNRTFTEIENELIAFIQQYYPEVLSDFTDSSVGSMLIGLNAGVANNLGVNTDRAFQETQLEFAQQTESILAIAKNLGFNIPARRPSVTVIDYTVNVPVKGDAPDSDYYPTLLPQSQVIGSSRVFENDQVIDWNSPFSNLGTPNRSIVPVLDQNGIIRSYNVTKREVVTNGTTNIFRRTITDADVAPFFKIRLPDPDVLEISDIILIPGTNFTGNPSEEDFNNPLYKYYEVDYLAQQRVFVEDVNGGKNNLTTGNTGIKAAKWIDVTQKFIKEFTANGFCEITFGGGNGEVDAFKEGFLKAGVTNQNFLNNYLENTALGEKLRRGSTLFIRYKTGGGAASNVGTNVITNLGNFTLSVNGSREDLNQQVRRSLSVTNPIPAIGGNDGLSVEQIRFLAKYNFSSQRRDVQITDYLFQIYEMPGKFGSPFRANAFREDNKVVIPILGIGSDGKLNNTSNTLLKENIAEYLTEFRMVNDYVEVRDGRIFNLAFDVEVFVEERNDAQIANDIIRAVSAFFNVNDKQMNEDVFITPLIEQINNVSGVVNVLSLKAFNKVGGQYSVNPIEQTISDQRTGEILIQNQTIYSSEDSMFEIKFPERDIRVFARKRVNLGI